MRETKFSTEQKKLALHEKECEFRFKYWLNKEDIYTEFKKTLLEYVKNF